MSFGEPHVCVCIESLTQAHGASYPRYPHPAKWTTSRDGRYHEVAREHVPEQVPQARFRHVQRDIGGSQFLAERRCARQSSLQEALRLGRVSCDVVTIDQSGFSPVPSLHADLYMGRRVMLHLVQPDRTYSPETVAVMGAAFDRVCQSISNEMNGNDAAKRTLALIILRLVDRGERDSARLAEIAFQEWTGTHRSAIGDCWATG